MALLNPDRTQTTATTFALLTATIIIAQQVAGKATRDALFLSHFDVTQLPKIVIAAAVLSMAAVLFTARLLTVFGPARVVPRAFGASAVLFVGEWVLFGSHPEVAAVLLYLHMAIFGAILISGFWSVVNERFDPHTAKQTIARVAAAATLGGVIGGVLAERVSSLVDVRAMLLVLSALHLSCVYGVMRIGTPTQRPSPDDSAPGGLRLISTVGYLRQMALLMVLLALMAALIDYVFKAEASARFTSGEDLVRFFAVFYATVGVLTFVVQTALGPRFLQRFGIGTTIAVLPSIAFIGGLAAAAMTQFTSLVLLRGGQAVFSNSFHRSAFELLYTPLSPEQKRPTKTIIDVASDRLGDMLGGGVILALLALTSRLPNSAVVASAAVTAGFALYLVTRLHHGYVGQLARSLRKGSVSLKEDEIVDATTQHILAETNVYTERELLMAKIKEHRQAREQQRPKTTGQNAASELSDDDVKSILAASPRLLPQTTRPSSPHAQLVEAVADLSADDIPRVRYALRSNFMDVRLTPHLIPLLGRDELAEDARMELRWLVPRIIGQLTDALLDPDQPLLVRQRLPGVLEVCHNRRAIDALLLGLTDTEFNVRYACARTLSRMQSRNPGIKVKQDEVFSAVRLEVDVPGDVWAGRVLTIDTTLPVDALGDNSGLPKVNRSLEHVFSVLSLCLDADALRLALQAIHSKDRNLHGTALEYLENVLPDDIRVALWKHIGVSRRPPAATRNHQTVAGELKRKLKPS